MPRKVSKARIEKALAEVYTPWRTKVDLRIAALKNKEARKYITEWADDVHTRIAEGDFGFCTTALAASVIRDIVAWETGFYVGIDKTTGGRKLATFGM